MNSFTEKLEILAGAAKYDVSCSSSGGKRKNINNGLGNSDAMGICHSFTEDGRCVSLLKILLTNYCIYDCAYCSCRKSNDIKKAAFTVKEIVDLTIDFYRRNYIEGLFLSSGIFKNPDYTMERLVRVAKDLRTQHSFNGYIHLKSIPGCSKELLNEAGLYADRLSINLELPTEKSLTYLAPEKSFQSILEPMEYLNKAILDNRESKKTLKSTPLFASAGQTTQIIVGATPDTDFDILKVSENLYTNKNLKRVYYSAYIPISNDKRVSEIKETSLIRENRLYQADWLFRLYNFQLTDIVSDEHPTLDLNIDPKLSFALKNYHLYPIEINKDDYDTLIKVPGLGIKSAKKIIHARKYGTINFEHLIKLGVMLNRAKYFITCSGKSMVTKFLYPEIIKGKLFKAIENNSFIGKNLQLSLFA